MATGAIERPLSFRIDQLGIVVRDLDARIAFLEQMGLGPFRVEHVNVGPVEARLGFAQVGSLQVELIDIVRGETTHTRFLRERGEGLHHVGWVVDDFDAKLEAVRGMGIEVLEGNLERGAIDFPRYAYLDTTKQSGFILELIEAPAASG